MDRITCVVLQGEVIPFKSIRHTFTSLLLNLLRTFILSRCGENCMFSRKERRFFVRLSVYLYFTVDEPLFRRVKWSERFDVQIEFKKNRKKKCKIEKLDWKFSPNHTEILFKVKFTLCYETEFKRNISESRHDLCQDLLIEFP